MVTTNAAPAGARDAALAAEMERYFANTDSKILSAFQVVKCLPAAGGHKRLPKPTGKARMLCLTLGRQRDSSSRCTLHVLKRSTRSTWETARSYRMRQLARVELCKAPREGPQYVELQFTGTGYMRGTDVRVVVQLREYDEAVELLREVYHVMLVHEKQMPTFAGVSVAELQESPAEALLLVDDVLSPEAALAEEVGGLALALGESEAAELHALLGTLAGAGGLAAHEEDMQEELDGLERANVHAIMNSLELGQQIGEQLQEAIASLDDLDQSLQVFDIKLRHMREDIASIEARNNRLERVARNDAALLDALEKLLQKLDVPGNVIATLTQRPITRDRLPEVISAAWDLNDRLSLLRGGEGGASLSEWLSNMTAVAEQHAALIDYSERFTERAAAFLDEQLPQIAAAAVRGVNAKALEMPDHTAMRAQFAAMEPLLEAMSALDPPSVLPLRAKYALTINKLLHQELQLYVQQLERGVLGRDRSAGAAAASEFAVEGGAGGGVLEGGRSGGFVGGEHAPELDWTFQMGDAAGLLSAHRAYKLFLDSFMPFLSEEAEVACDFFQLGAAARDGSGSARRSASGSGSGRGMTAAAREAAALSGTLLDGMAREVVAMSNVAKRANQPLSVAPMVDVTVAWAERLRGDGGAGALLLANALDEAKVQLVEQFKAYVDVLLERLGSFHVHHRMSGARTVKGLHVLPSVDNFVRHMTTLEDLLKESAMLAGKARAGAPQLKRAMAGAHDRSHSRGEGEEEGGYEDDDSADDEIDYGVAAPEVVAASAFPPPAAVHDARQVVDAAYALLLQALCDGVEKMAALDPKHGTRLRMENYLMLDLELRAHAGGAEILSVYLSKVSGMRRSALGAYVRQQLEYVKFWGLVRFSANIDHQLDNLPREEIALLHPANEVRALVMSTMRDCDKKLARMNERVRKHLEGSSPALVEAVWDKLRTDLLYWYGRLDEQIKDCYPRSAVRLSPSPEQLAELFKAV